MAASEDALRKDILGLQQQNAALRRAVVDGPAANCLRYVAPFIREAIAAGLWAHSHGASAVEREVASTLRYLQQLDDKVLTGGQ